MCILLQYVPFLRPNIHCCTTTYSRFGPSMTNENALDTRTMGRYSTATTGNSDCGSGVPLRHAIIVRRCGGFPFVSRRENHGLGKLEQQILPREAQTDNDTDSALDLPDMRYLEFPGNRLLNWSLALCNLKSDMWSRRYLKYQRSAANGDFGKTE